MSDMGRPGRLAPHRAAVLVGLALVLVGCGGGSDRGASTLGSAGGSPAASAGSVGPGAAGSAAGSAIAAGPPSLALPGGPDWLAADDRYLYVKLDWGGVVRIDPESNQPAGSVNIGGDLCQGVGAGYGAVWTCRGEELVRLDFETGQVTAIEGVVAAGKQAGIPAGFDRIWVLANIGGQLVSVDPVTNQVDPPIDLGALGSDIAVTDTAVWVTSRLDNAVVKVDPATRTVTARLDGIDQPESIAVGDHLWVGGRTTSTEIDPTTATVVKTVDVGTGPAGAIAVDGSTLWVRDPDHFLRSVDAGGAVETIDGPVTSGGDVLVAFGSVWATAFDEELLFRVPAG